MDALSEEFRRSEQADMTMLTCEEMTELEEPAVSDEVEDLRNSLREAVHDEGVRPKMQCLMMDGSFSMVTVQGEDSAIQWETSVSRSATPWAAEPQEAPMMRASTPSSGQAGRIIFVMDEEQIASRRRARERVSSPKKEVFLPEDVDPVSGRKELVEVSQPNVKLEGDGEQEEAVDVMEHKRLFRLVSEGSEILNMMVPSETNLASVDEEESTVMVDNLSYLEETPATKTNEEYDDNVFEPFNEPPPPPPPGKAVRSSRGSVSLSRGGVMDPPGAPVSRPPPPGKKAAGNVDYFEKFTLIDGQAPGSPALVPQGAEDLRRLEETKSPGSEETDLLRHSSASQRTTAVEEAAPELLPGDDELASDHMDDVFYGATDAVPGPKDREDKKRPPRLSLKSSGSALFGSQEDLVLTPIFLPEGPAKIIDQILLEEPKAMAFMYTDLYEESMGCRGKEEDTESLSSEKSFHSRHSDREARGYLEMYVLKDETPAPPPEEDVEHAPPPETEAAAPTRGNNGKEPIVRMLSQDSYDFGESEISDALLNAEEEVTDFLRASDNSSPCDIDPFPQSQPDENDATSSAKSKPRRRRKAAQTTETTPQIPSDQPAENETAAGQTTDFGEFYLGIDKTPAADTFAAPKAPGPVAPPRKKADSAPKATLDLTPLMPVDVLEEGEAAGGKEQREEEKETASPVETADEGDEGEQKPSTEAPEAAADTDAQTAERKDSEPTARETSDTETAKGLTGQEVAVIEAVDSVHARVEEAERPKETEAAVLSAGVEQSECPVAAAVTEPAKQPGRCVIL